MPVKRMRGLRSEIESRAVVSVGELVQRRLSASDGWNLALVQRDEVWDELRMRHLLDSLLADYPIGAILLSTVRGESRELVVQPDGSREEVSAAAGSWQVLDGQQRINALFSIFTDKGRYGQFLVDMLMERPAPSPAQGRKAKERAMPHIRHLQDREEELEGRERFLDLSGWATWAEGKNLADLRVDRSTVAPLLVEIDSQFTVEMSDDQAAVAATNLQRLIRAWTKQSIPLLRAEMDTPLDVLEVFSRINLGGVDVAGADVYFAGVKTFWLDAEARVDQILGDAPMLRNRLGALRFLSRLAGRALGQGDVLPLTVDRLAGKRGELLRAALAELTEPKSVVRERLSAFTDWYTKASDLGYVLHQVTPELWDDVLGWVATSPRSDPAWYAPNRTMIDTYLLGATLFRYRSVMGDTFRRIAFHEAVEAGSAGQEFPLEEIIAVTRGKTRLRGSRGQAVLGVESAEDFDCLARRNGWILTALAQRILYEWEAEDDFDWDHIFPQAQAHRMWSPGHAGRRRHHRDRHLVNSTGNFWALNKSANRSLQDLPGREKFDRLLSWAREGEGWRVWEEARWSITPQEIERYVVVDEKLNGDPESIDEAMEIFKQTVTGRAQRLLDEALIRFRGVRLLADDSDGLAHDPSRKKPDYREALRLDVGDVNLETLGHREARNRLRERGRVLGAEVAERLTQDNLLADTWRWEPNSRSSAEMAFACFELVGGNCVELMLKWEPSMGARIEMKAYPNRGRPNRRHLYPDFAEIPLGAPWSASDVVIIDAFLEHVQRVQERHPR